MPSHLRLLGAVVLLAGCADTPRGVTPEQLAGRSGASDVDPAVMADFKTYEAVADRFVGLARAGDVDGMVAMLSPNEVAHTGRSEVIRYSRETIIPFFRAHPTTPAWSTVSGATDAFGNRGLAFYKYAADASGKAHRPYSVYVVRENGKLVVASATVDVFVRGRHG